MKSLILAAFLFLSTTAAYASDTAYQLIVTRLYDKAQIGMRFDEHNDRELNKFDCIVKLEEVHKLLTERGVIDSVSMKCVPEVKSI